MRETELVGPRFSSAATAAGQGHPALPERPQEVPRATPSLDSHATPQLPAKPCIPRPVARPARYGALLPSGREGRY